MEAVVLNSWRHTIKFGVIQVCPYIMLSAFPADRILDIEQLHHFVSILDYDRIAYSVKRTPVCSSEYLRILCLLCVIHLQLLSCSSQISMISLPFTPTTRGSPLAL